MQEESTARMLVICVVHLIVYCKMPLAGLRECNVEERIMTIVRSVTRTRSIFCCIQYWCYEQCRCGLHARYYYFPFPFPHQWGISWCFPHWPYRIGQRKSVL